MTENSLLNYGFKNDYVTLRCHVCKLPIHKYGMTVLYENNPELKVTVKFGWCRWYTHGISVSRLMR